MKQFWIGFLLFLALPALQAQTVADYFYVIPDAYFPQLESNRLKDMVDMKLAVQQAKAPNLLGGEVEILELTADYLKVRVSDASTFEMKQFKRTLPKEEADTILCVIRTTCGPQCDSEVLFFTPQWQSIPDEEVSFTPRVTDFLKPNLSMSDSLVAQAMESVDMPLFVYSFVEGSDSTLQVSQDWAADLPDAIAKEVVPYFETQIELPIRYNGKSKK